MMFNAGVYIFYYHDISSCPDVPLTLRTSPGRFFQEISFIEHHFNIIGFNEAISLLRLAAKSDKKAQISVPYAVINFDDGFLSFSETVYPYFKRARIPCTLFLNGSFVLQRTVADAISLEIIKSWPEEKLSDYLPGIPNKKLRQYVYDQSSLNLHHELNEWTASSRVKRKLYMDEDDLCSLDPHLVRFGNHTFHHLKLSNLSKVDQLSEVSTNHDYLSRYSNYDNLMAIPYGGYDSFDENTVEIARDFSDNVVITAVGGISHQMRDDKILDIERIGFNNNKERISRHIKFRTHQMGWMMRKFTSLKGIFGLIAH